MPAVAPTPTLSAGRADLDQLQGVWTSVAGPVEARFLIAGTRYAFEFVGGDIYIGSFEIAPGHMDMSIDEGPADHKGQVAPCIYHVDGGVLRWCPGRIGSGRRLTAFPSVDDEKYLSLVFRRAPRKARRR
jgi:hypothetical protein